MSRALSPSRGIAFRFICVAGNDDQAHRVMEVRPDWWNGTGLKLRMAQHERRSAPTETDLSPIAISDQA
jgi:hypothetical protein